MTNITVVNHTGGVIHVAIAVDGDSDQNGGYYEINNLAQLGWTRQNPGATAYVLRGNSAASSQGLQPEIFFIATGAPLVIN